MTSLSLRLKLLFAMVGGAALLTLLLIGITIVVLMRSATQAKQEATNGLRDQALADLKIITDRSVTLTRERIDQVDSAVAVAARVVEIALLNPPTVPVSLVARADGSLHDPRPGRTTSVYVPAGVPRADAERDYRLSSGLDSLFSSQGQTTRNLHSMVFVGSSGLVRLRTALTGPLPPNEVLQRFVDLNDRFKTSGERQPTWLSPFPAPFESGLATDTTVVALVKPIYQANEYHGLIVYNVSLSQLTNDLLGLSPTAEGYSFVIDQERRLIAVPDPGVAPLTNYRSDLAETYTPISRTVSPELDAVIEEMVRPPENASPIQTTEVTVQQVMVEGRPFLISFAPIEGPGWSLGIMSSLDELTASAEGVARVIEDNSWEGTSWVLGAAFIFVFITSLLSLLLSSTIARPLVALTAAAERLGRGEEIDETSLNLSRRDEVGRLASAFRAMNSSLASYKHDIEQQNQQLEATVTKRTSDLQRTVRELETVLGERARLGELLKSVSTPVIPVSKGVVLLPLVGSLDEQRASEALTTLLELVERNRVRVAIIDVTGLPIIDTAVARTLLQAVRAVQLLGAETLIAGIRPEVAETLVALDIDLSELHSTSNLQNALMRALRVARG